jgi:hypothetical protein
MNRVRIQYFEATPIDARGVRLQRHTGYGISVYDEAEEWHDWSFDSLEALLAAFPPDRLLDALALVVPDLVDWARTHGYYLNGDWHDPEPPGSSADADGDP